MIVKAAKTTLNFDCSEGHEMALGSLMEICARFDQVQHALGELDHSQAGRTKALSNGLHLPTRRTAARADTTGL